MTDRNTNRPGYKKTKAGWIPEEWQRESLSAIADIQTGIAKCKKMDGYLKELGMMK